MSLSTVRVIPSTVASTLPAYDLARADSGQTRLPSLSVGRLSHSAIQIASGEARPPLPEYRPTHDCRCDRATHLPPFLRSVVSNPVIFDPYLQASWLGNFKRTGFADEPFSSPARWVGKRFTMICSAVYYGHKGAGQRQQPDQLTSQHIPWSALPRDAPDYSPLTRRKSFEDDRVRDRAAKPAIPGGVDFAGVP